MPFLVIPFPMINPVAVEIGPLPLRWYALSYIAGFVLGWFYLRWLVTCEALWRPGQSRPTKEQIDDLLVYVAFGVIIGGRLGHVLIYDPSHYLAHPLEVFETWRGGMAFHGGLLGAIAGLSLFAWRQRLPLFTVADLCSIVAPIGLVPRPARQFHQAGDVGPADRRSLGDGLSRRRPAAAPSEPALRGGARGARAALRVCALAIAFRRAEAARPRRRRFRSRLCAGAHFLRILPRARPAARLSVRRR